MIDPKIFIEFTNFACQTNLFHCHWSAFNLVLCLRFPADLCELIYLTFHMNQTEYRFYIILMEWQMAIYLCFKWMFFQIDCNTIFDIFFLLFYRNCCSHRYSSEKSWLHWHEPDAPFVMASIRWANATYSEKCPLLTVNFSLGPMNCARIAWKTASFAKVRIWPVSTVQTTTQQFVVWQIEKTKMNEFNRHDNQMALKRRKTIALYTTTIFKVQFSKSKSIQMLG